MVHIEMKADSLSSGYCLHRDHVPAIGLEEEENEATMKRDDLFLKNMEAIESTLTVATFGENGIKGDWLVN